MTPNLKINCDIIKTDELTIRRLPTVMSFEINLKNLPIPPDYENTIIVSLENAKKISEFINEQI